MDKHVCIREKMRDEPSQTYRGPDCVDRILNGGAPRANVVRSRGVRGSGAALRRHRTAAVLTPRTVPASAAARRPCCPKRPK
eukprot:5351155-Pleurochrysis_carterae.AAC.1